MRKLNIQASNSFTTYPAERSVLQAILDNYLLLSALILLFLIAVPALIMRGRGVRDPSRPERRSKPRPGVDRRA